MKSEKIIYSRHYPSILFLVHLPFLLYMHKSKVSSRGIELDNTFEYLSYFHAELILYAFICLACTYIKILRHLLLPIFLSIYYINVADWSSWSTQSKAFFFSDINRAIQLLIHYPEFWQKLSVAFKIKLYALILFPVFFSIFSRSKIVSNLISAHLNPIKLVSAAITASIVISTPIFASNAFAYQNSLTFMISELLYERELAQAITDPGEMAQRLGHKKTQNPENINFTARHHNKPNIIFFVIETGPYKYYPDIRTLVQQAGIKWLSNHSVVFENHFSTYPGSDRSTYSIYSGHYPPTDEDNNWKVDMNYGNSLPKSLAKHGYRSYLFSTAPLTFNNDAQMYKNLAFDSIHETSDVNKLRVKTEHGFDYDRSKLYDADIDLITETIEIISQFDSKSSTSPFFIAVSPQSSHAPFHCPPAEGEVKPDCSSDIEKIRSNAIWQAGLIKRIVDTLESTGSIDNTIMVITADHVLRSAHETPLFNSPHFLHETTFHVPMMIAASNIDSSTENIRYATSHVDIAATVIDMAGIQRAPSDFHGINMFDKQDRTIYFISKGYSAANGYRKDNHFFMENRSNNTYIKSNAFDFLNQDNQADDYTLKFEVRNEFMLFEAFLRKLYHPS